MGRYRIRSPSKTHRHTLYNFSVRLHKAQHFLALYVESHPLLDEDDSRIVDFKYAYLIRECGSPVKFIIEFMFVGIVAIFFNIS